MLHLTFKKIQYNKNTMVIDTRDYSFKMSMLSIKKKYIPIKPFFFFYQTEISRYLLFLEFIFHSASPEFYSNLLFMLNVVYHSIRLLLNKMLIHFIYSFLFTMTTRLCIKLFFMDWVIMKIIISIELLKIS